MQSHNTFSLYRQTSPTFSDISTPSSPPSSPPVMASFDQQLQEALATINGLTEKIQSLTSNLDTLQNENQALPMTRICSYSLHATTILPFTLYVLTSTSPSSLPTMTFRLSPTPNSTSIFTLSHSTTIHSTSPIFIQRSEDCIPSTLFWQT